MSAISYLNAAELIEKLPWLELIDAIDAIFNSEVIEPLRHQHDLKVPDEPTASLLLKPAWIEGEYIGVKQVTVFPGNNAKGLPGLNSNYLLSCGKTGQPLLQVDGDELTARRTAASSALASRYLSRLDSKKLLMMGSGRLARSLVDAHIAVRPITEIKVWSRSEASAQKMVDDLISNGLSASVCSTVDLPQETASADIISCATLSTEALVLGKHLSKGTHVDLVGAFKPTMRETDNEVIQKSSVFVDTREAALTEAGDLTQAIEAGSFEESKVIAELSELSNGKHIGRDELKNPDSQITLFKSVGAAREDLAAAILAYQGL